MTRTPVSFKATIGPALLTLLLSTCSGTVASTPASAAESYQHHDTREIHRDVAIIGGGAVGTHASITMGEVGLSTVIVERSSNLGGPARTYVDPGTGTPIDYGVLRYENSDVTVRYFEKLGIKAVNDFLPPNFNSSAFLNFNTGLYVKNFNPPRKRRGYEEALSAFPYLVWGKHLPNPVPKDLLLPFREYMKKYDLGDSVYSINKVWGGADILSVPTLNVVYGLGLVEIALQAPTGSFRIISGNEQPYIRHSTTFANKTFSSTPPL